jgi:hypothetical protein
VFDSAINSLFDCCKNIHLGFNQNKPLAELEQFSYPTQ